MTYNILVSLIASLIFVFLGYFASKLFDIIRTRRHKVLWRPFLKSKQDIAIILTTRPGPYIRSTPRVSLNEMLAYTELSELFRKLRMSLLIIPSNIAKSTDLANRHLVILGGPKANQCSAQIWRIIGPRMPVRFNLDKQTLQVAERTYVPELDKNGMIIHDYGLIIRTKNPLSERQDKYAMMAFGCHGHSTYGAMHSVLIGNLVKDIYRHAGKKDFLSIIKVDLQENKIVSTKVLECYIIL